jgi:large conductance mechanosensitive channel
MGWIKEFKEFAIKGNVMDLAVAVIIGAAFGKIVTSIVDDLIMPVVGRLTKGQGDWQLYSFHGIKIGHFAGTVVDFVIVAFSIFLIVKGLNSLKKEEPVAVAAPEMSSTDKLLVEIRDALKK